jgi:DNA modification methylase
MRDMASEVRRVLSPEGSLWLNLGDTYNTRAIIRGSSHQGGLGHDNESIRLSWAEARDRGLVRYSARQPGLKDKDLMGLPWRVAMALVADGWFLRADVIWSKPYGAPENALDRPSRYHEYLFLLTPCARYRYDKAACPEAHGSVWTIAPGSSEGEHRAVFPDELVRRCVLVSSVPGDVVLDPFAGSGTTQRVAGGLGRLGLGLDGRVYA